MKLQPLLHQQKSIEFASKLAIFADFSEPGTGKTYVQIAIMEKRNVFPVLILCPKSIINSAWISDIQKFSNLSSVAVIGTAEKKIKALSLPVQIYITNYDSLNSDKVLDALIKKKFDYIIVDESTAIKSCKSLRTKILKKLSKNTKYKSIMTGTPCPNSPLDIYSQLEFLDNRILGYQSFWQFKNDRFVPDYMGFNWTAKKGTEEFINKCMYTVGIRHLKKDCLDLPEKIYQVREIELTSEQRKIYKEIKEEYIAEMDGKTVGSDFAMVVYLRLQQLIGGHLPTLDKENIVEFEENPKLSELKEILEELGNQQVIIFANFRWEIKKILSILGDKAIGLYGETKDKDESIIAFQTGQKQYLVANAVSAGHGITFVNCSTIIYYSRSYNLEHYLQSQARIDRIGQKNKMLYINIIAKNTIDNVIDKALQEKKSLNQLITDNLKEK